MQTIFIILTEVKSQGMQILLSIGVDIDTGGHIFQLMFSNAQSANEPGFISNAEGDWSEGDIYFGFHIVRVF